MIFFQSASRTSASAPFYTNLDIQSQLAYGMEVWQMYLLFFFPTLQPLQSAGIAAAPVAGVPPNIKLLEAFLFFGVLQLELGQENQTRWPLSRFGAGGGMAVSSGIGSDTGVVQAGNAIPDRANVMALPEPIEMPRTQNISASIRLAPQAQAMLGTVTAPGVGSPLGTYDYQYDDQNTANLVELPFSVQFGMVGRRIKKTQYGQIPDNQTAG